MNVGGVYYSMLSLEEACGHGVQRDRCWLSAYCRWPAGRTVGVSDLEICIRCAVDCDDAFLVCVTLLK